MKTTIDFVDEVYKLVATPEVHAITSGIYKEKRPFGSKGTDIVINSLPVTGGELQEAVVNLNIHVPNAPLTINDKQDVTQPNRKKLKEVSDLVIPLVEEAYLNGSDIEVQRITLLEEEDIKEHFLNIRLSIYSPNI